MRSINLYILTRTIEQEMKALYEKALSDRSEEIKVRNEEYELITAIVNTLLAHGAATDALENWFYSFSIPQIGKEFDLLKIGKNQIVNIELKSQEVSMEKISKQLIQNRMYLRHINRTIHSFTYMGRLDGPAELFKYENNTLRKASFTELFICINGVGEALDDGIEKLFRPADYLISPLSTPDKFLNGEYYLNNQQSSVKRYIIEGVRKGETLFGIRGSAGTGKTLLLYDLAKTLSSEYRICIIHSGILTEGHKYLDEKMDNVIVIDESAMRKELFAQCDIVCVDEAQRLYQDDLNIITEACLENQIKACIFSYDYAQVLSKAEYMRNNPGQLRELGGFQEFNLKSRIRANSGIYSFVRTLLRLYDIPGKEVDYSDIEIVYANDESECKRILGIYQNRGYTFISYTSQHAADESMEYLDYADSHLVIGREFDRVVQVMGADFWYDEDGELQGVEQSDLEESDFDYLFDRMLYQNLTRAREKICIIVLGNEKLFNALLMIKEHKYAELKKTYIRNIAFTNSGEECV